MQSTMCSGSLLHSFGCIFTGAHSQDVPASESFSSRPHTALRFRGINEAALLWTSSICSGGQTDRSLIDGRQCYYCNRREDHLKMNSIAGLQCHCLHRPEGSCDWKSGMCIDQQNADHNYKKQVPVHRQGNANVARQRLHTLCLRPFSKFSSNKFADPGSSYRTTFCRKCAEVSSQLWGSCNHSLILQKVG